MGLGFEVCGLGFPVWGTGFVVWVFGFWVLGFGFEDLGFRVWGFRGVPLSLLVCAVVVVLGLTFWVQWSQGLGCCSMSFRVLGSSTLRTSRQSGRRKATLSLSPSLPPPLNYLSPSLSPPLAFSLSRLTSLAPSCSLSLSLSPPPPPPDCLSLSLSLFMSLW